jgi:hypothetical protein
LDAVRFEVAMEKEGLRHRFVPTTWLRGIASLEDGWIVLDPARATKYPLYEETEVPYDLTRVERPPDALAFVRQYGLLWHGPGADDHRERFENWKNAASGIASLCTMLIRLREAARGDRTAIDWLWGLAPQFQELFSEALIQTDDQLLAYASKAIAAGVNWGLAGVDQLVFAEVDWKEGRVGEFVMSAHAPTLLGYAYHRLALDIAGRTPLAGCPECGRIFEIVDPRQRYCDSTCAGRARYRRWTLKRPLRPEPPPKLGHGRDRVSGEDDNG